MSKDTNLFKILAAVTDSETISSVSNKLFLSEPYVSKVIHQAENHYGVILINRKKKPISLTKAGEVVLKQLRQITEIQNELEYDLSLFKKQKNYEIRIAMNQPWLATNAQNLVSFLIKKYPQISFSFYEQTTNIAQEALLNHSTDIFIGKVLINQQIKSNYICDSRLYFVIPENSPLFSLEGNELTPAIFKKFDNLPFVSLTDDSFFQAMVDHLFQDHNINLYKIVKVANSLSAIKLSVAGLGYTIGMRDLAEKEAKIQNKKFKLIHIPTNELQLSIGTSYRSDTYQIVKDISKTIHEYLLEHNLFA